MCLINQPYLYLLRFWDLRFLTKGKSYFYDLYGIPRGYLETNSFKVNPSEAKKMWKSPLWLPQRQKKCFFDVFDFLRGHLETNSFKVNPSEAKKIWKLPLWLPQRSLQTNYCKFENKNALKKTNMYTL